MGIDGRGQPINSPITNCCLGAEETKVRAPAELIIGSGRR